jgi:hypothetical protein
VIWKNAHLPEIPRSHRAVDSNQILAIAVGMLAANRPR